MQGNTLSNTCRTCMATDVSFLPLFTSEQHTEKTPFKSLAQCIVAFTDIEVERGDGLPCQICSLCAKKIIEWYNFKQMCANTDKILRTTFKPAGCANTQVETVIIKPELPLEDDLEGKINDIVNEGLNQGEAEQKKTIKGQANAITVEKSLEPTENNSSHQETVEYVECEDEVPILPNEEFVEHLESDLQDGEPVSDCIPKTEASEPKDWQCPACDMSCTYVSEFDKHLDMHVKKKNQCETCGKSFTKPSHLTRHLYTHDAVKPYNCQECNKGFARLQQYTHHMNMHNGVKPHVCKQCGKGFSQMSNLKDHIRTHNGEKPFLCSVCGKGFNQLGNLRQHTIRHSGVKAHLCNICGSGFASKGELSAHTRKHTGAKPYICDVCNHGFTTSSSLVKHKRIHSGEKPYECEVCKMRFSRSGILSRHRRTHTGEKPYACKHCTRAFAQSNDLASHLRIHTGERPYVCDVCGQAFRQTSALKTHKKIHRRGEAKPFTEGDADKEGVVESRDGF